MVAWEPSMVPAFLQRLSAPPTHVSAPPQLAAQLPGVHSSGEMGPGDALLSSLPGWASQALGLAEILVWGSHRVPQSECCSWAGQLLGTSDQVLQKAFLESDTLSLWDRWPAAPDLATWRLRLSQPLKRTNAISISRHHECKVFQRRVSGGHLQIPDWHVQVLRNGGITQCIWVTFGDSWDRATQGSGWHPTHSPSSPAMGLTGSWCSSQVSGLSLWGGRAKFRILAQQRLPSPT